MKENKKSYGERADKVFRSWIEITRLFNQIRSKESQFLDQFGLTLHQFGILEALYHKGDMSVSTLTKTVLSTPGNVTVVLKNLEKLNYIKREQDLEDKRTNIIKILPSGSALIELIFIQHTKNMKENFILATDEELENITLFMKKIRKSIQK